ncbi:kinase suppressor of Ras 2-like isoform X3 [Macrobrachium nipponense]|uniref:kinase suppressor of Ras 2-like isoform X3 n=1 Tax=Macrobrachium nipponense TaxID=159736 RepID=UPI0030C89592
MSWGGGGGGCGGVGGGGSSSSGGDHHHHHHHYHSPSSSHHHHQHQQEAGGGVGGGGGGGDVVAKALETCATHHQFIASQAEHLERLRSQCATSAQLTQQEIRTLEGKLVKLFSLQLVTKRHLPPDVSLPKELQLYPSLKQWLQVVGLCKDSVNGICQRVLTLEALLEKRENELRNILSDYGADRSEAHKLARAMHNLKRYTEIQMQGQGGEWSSSELPLYWDSWERSCPPSPRPCPRSQRECRSSVSSSDGDCGSATSGSTSGGAWSGEGSRSSGRGAPVSQRSSDDSSTPSSPPPPLSLVPPLSPGGIHTASTHTLTGSGLVFSEKRYTPPNTPNVLPKGKSPGDKRFPTTPPPGKKYQTGLLNPQPSLGRSTSHESQLAPRPEGYEQPSSTLRTRLHSESEASASTDGTTKRNESTSRSRTDVREHRTAQNSPAPSTLASPIKSPHYVETVEDENLNRSTLSVPKSPRTPTLTGSMGSMVHNVNHRFIKTIKSATCGYCQLKIPILSGLKCKECHFKCHRECESKVPPSCGLPHEFLQIFTDTLKKGGIEGSGLSSRGTPGVSPSHHHNDVFPQIRTTISYSQPSINVPFFQGPDSSSNTSSCNSSTPSSPALISASPKHTGTFRFPVTRGFHFPEYRQSPSYNGNSVLEMRCKPKIVVSRNIVRNQVAENPCGDIPLEMRPLKTINNRIPPKAPLSTSSPQSDVIDSRQSHDSDRTVSQTSGSGSTGTDDSERTIAGRVDSQDSTVSDGENADPRCTRQNSVSSVSQSLREWDIPYDELDRREVIGRGRFGIVYSGNWHGQVAIKELRMDYVNDEKTLEAFKAEVSTFRKTRHENLVLFMGACMKPPRLAIVTSLCKGRTLYQHIHVLKDKFNMSRTIMIAQQISQGMGYLHARGIVHKDLKTKNIFLENGKVVITDFGLFNVTRLCHDSRRGNWLSIPPGWLCYLSPEVMRNLRVVQKQEDSLPFTTYSDVYGFGTVWYELLCGEWPHKGLPPEAIIWQVGRGMKPSLAHLQASRDVKDILMACWSYRPDERPEFSTMLTNLTRLPKKRLHRSPSHPIHLSRSAESVF